MYVSKSAKKSRNIICVSQKIDFDLLTFIKELVKSCVIKTYFIQIIKKQQRRRFLNKNNEEETL